ncbi:MAG: 50S ribosomal protein L13 [Candidatus Micrarchaeota archaeon]
MKIYDAKGAVVGRMAAKVAKDLLSGEEVHVLNAAQMIFSGSPKYHKEKLTINRSLTDKRNPENAEKFPRVPYMLFKKAVGGMLPKKSQRGRDALKRLRAYDAIPAEIDASKAEVYAPAVKDSLQKSMTLGNLCKAFGYKN